MASAFKCDYCGEYKDGEPSCYDDGGVDMGVVFFDNLFSADVPTELLPPKWSERAYCPGSNEPRVEVTIRVPLLLDSGEAPEVCEQCLFLILIEGYKLLGKDRGVWSSSQ